ncbi:MAG: hypothetical protein KGL44_00970 [Sphingomonadales bacterium]|nr:hypothetical protein [Sphingomonadales bacterium]
MIKAAPRIRALVKAGEGIIAAICATGPLVDTLSATPGPDRLKRGDFAGIDVKRRLTGRLYNASSAVRLPPHSLNHQFSPP